MLSPNTLGDQPGVPAAEQGVGARVLVARDPGLMPAEAVILAVNEYRPHLVKVRYLRSQAGAWIARSRILETL
jgi:hypothetical protein